MIHTSKKHKKKSKHERLDRLEKIVLATAILDLLHSVIELLKQLID